MIRVGLRSFHAVASHGGFLAASRKLRVSQPTVSTQVKALEARYDVELFVRSGRSVKLTAAGKELYEITSRLHQAEQEATQLLQSFSGWHHGKLALAAVGPFHATDMIVAYKTRYPAIDVEVTFGNSKQCFENILSLNADVGILAEVAHDKRVTTVPYSKHEVVVFVNSNHPFSSREAIRIEELQGQKVVRREIGSTTRIAVETELARRGVSVETILELGSREGVWKAVEQGMGLGFVADFEFVPHPNLRAVRLSDASIQTRYYLAYLSERAESRLIRSFTELALKGT